VTGGIFAVLEIQQLSPLHIVERLPDILQGDYTDVNRWRILLIFFAASAVISSISIFHFGRKDL
jgi:hypothetical protein